MKEIRTIKRSFTQDETLGSLPRDARLLFVGLICIVDDHGRFRAHPSLVRSSVFPYDDDLSAANCGELLRALQAAGRIVLWDQDGQTYGEIVNWSKHQRVDNAARSDLPERPPSANCGERRQPAANGGDPALERRGKDRKGTTPLPPTNGTVVDLPKRSRTRLSPSESERFFEEFWQEYPRKVGKRAARQAWDKAMRVTGPVTIRVALRAALPELRKKDPQYIPHPTTWLNQGRWEDEGPARTKPAVPRGETRLCGGCDHDVVLAAGRCPTYGAVADIPTIAEIAGKPEIEICRGWEWINGRRPQGTVDRVARVDNGRDRGADQERQEGPGRGRALVGQPGEVRGHERGAGLLPHRPAG